VPEGTIIYPNTPLITVTASLIEAQLIETAVLCMINHQSLIATKANRICRAARGAVIMEFGARRAQGPDAAEYGTRASYIGGVHATATVSADMKFGVPAVGTMAHSWVQLFPSEYDSFKAYAELYPDACTLLIDTYNVVKSGLPNAIRTAREVLAPLGKRLKGVRIDSGDIAYLTKYIRRELDFATDAEPGWFGPDSMTWRIHADRSMLVGGLRALYLQVLHPLAMAGVAEHSAYREGPLGRLARTGRFVAATTYGTSAEAERAVGAVRTLANVEVEVIHGDEIAKSAREVRDGDRVHRPSARARRASMCQERLTIVRRLNLNHSGQSYPLPGPSCLGKNASAPALTASFATWASPGT
jgi:hypothetical protein